MKYGVALASMLVIAACAMGGQKAVQAPAEATRPQTMPAAPGSQKAELDELFAQVEQERMSMGLPEVASGNAVPMGTFPTTQTDNACHPAESETCTSSCKLSDSICTNADRICKLADELKPDADAEAKCDKAGKTCKTAHDKCCGCQQ